MGFKREERRERERGDRMGAKITLAEYAEQA